MIEEVPPDGVVRQGDHAVISLEGGAWHTANWILVGVALVATGWVGVAWSGLWWLVPLGMAALFTVDARWPSEVRVTPSGVSRWSPWPLQSFEVAWREVVGVQQKAWGLTLVRARGVPVAIPTITLPRAVRQWLRAEIERRVGASSALMPGVWSADRLEVPVGDPSVRNALVAQVVALVVSVLLAGVFGAVWSTGSGVAITLGVVVAMLLLLGGQYTRALSAPDALALNPHELAALRGGATLWAVPWASILEARLVEGVIQVRLVGGPMRAVATHATVLDAEGARLVVRCINDLAGRSRAMGEALDGPDPEVVALLEGLRRR